ncbi:hypothetical protein FA13DRAFT_1731777, partial [Coprinellus micaceus]
TLEVDEKRPRKRKRFGRVGTADDSAPAHAANKGHHCTTQALHNALPLSQRPRYCRAKAELSKGLAEATR